MAACRLMLLALASGLAVQATSRAQEPDKVLTPGQVELVQLMSMLQIAGVACNLTVDTAVLALTGREEGLTLNSEAEKKVIAAAMADARARFGSQKRGVECLYVVDEYGPRGTRMKGLVSKR